MGYSSIYNDTHWSAEEGVPNNAISVSKLVLYYFLTILIEYYFFNRMHRGKFPKYMMFKNNYIFFPLA